MVVGTLAVTPFALSSDRQSAALDPAARLLVGAMRNVAAEVLFVPVPRAVTVIAACAEVMMRTNKKMRSVFTVLSQSLQHPI